MVVEGLTALVDKGGDVVLQNLGILVLLGVLHGVDPRGRAVRLVKAKATGVEQLVHGDVAVHGLDNARMRLQAAHDGLELGHLLGRHAIALVERKRGAELDLLDEQALDIVLLDVVGEKRVAAVELVIHAGTVHHGHDVVQVERSGAALGLVADGRDGVGNGNGLADARGLDDDVVKVAGLGDGRELLRKVGGERAADAAVAHGNEAVGGGEAAVLDEARVNVNLADVVHNDGSADALVVGEDVVEERGLARPQVPGEHDYFYRSRSVLRGHACPLLPALGAGYVSGELEESRACVW